MTTFLHTMVRITDPDKSRAFYEALGFEFGHDMPIVRDGELEATNYFFSLPGQDDVLELTLNHDGRSYELGTGYGHIAIGVDDLSATLEQLAGVGIEPEKPPYSVREGGSKLCFVRDPDGYRIEIIGRGERRAPPRSTTEIVDAAGFEITITKQGWLDPAAADHDLCSHGDVRLAIGDQMIAPSDGGGDYGISKAALALLRTLHSDHSPEHPVAERLVPHGCGTILMMGCPIGIDWSVSHSAGRVRITDVVRYDGTGDSEAVRFPNVRVELPEHAYRQSIVAFARMAKQPFLSGEKLFVDDFDRQQYLDFWKEYDRLLRGSSPE